MLTQITEIKSQLRRGPKIIYFSVSLFLLSLFYLCSHFVNFTVKTSFEKLEKINHCLSKTLTKEYNYLFMS